jgi:dihydrofolate reductase
MTISLIVAADENNAIGHKGALLWHLPNDLKFFKNTTWAMPIIMGRKTFESVNKPLPGRTNIVVTRQAGWAFDGVTPVGNLNLAIDAASTLQTNELFIIGGGEIYAAAMPLATHIYLTRVHTRVQNADAFFPTVDTAIWHCTFKKGMAKDEKHAFDYTFETWVKL